MSGGTALFLQHRDQFGAMVVHVPLLHALRAGARPLVVYAQFERGRMFEALGLADETRLSIAPSALELGRELRARRFDTIVSLRPQSLRLSAAVAASGARARLGYRSALAPFAFTRAVSRDVSSYRPLHYLNLIEVEDRESLLVESMRALAARPRDDACDRDRPYCFMPCGSEVRKLWGDSKFVELARRILAADRDAHFVLVLGSSEIRFVEAFERAGLGERTSAIVDARLDAIARTVLGSRVVVANDCGPSHVAQMAGTPIVSIFGNWDGAAKVRIAEWFHPRAGACCLTTDRAAPLECLAVDDVLRATLHLAEHPRTPSAILGHDPREGGATEPSGDLVTRNA